MKTVDKSHVDASSVLICWHRWILLRWKLTTCWTMLGLTSRTISTGCCCQSTSDGPSISVFCARLNHSDTGNACTPYSHRRRCHHTKERWQEARLSLTNCVMLVCKVIEVWQDFLSEYVDAIFTTFLFPLGTPLRLSRSILHGWKDNSMLAKPLAACTYLSSIVSELYDA